MFLTSTEQRERRTAFDTLERSSCSEPSWMWGHNAGSACLPGLSGPTWQSCFPVIWPWSHTGAWSSSTGTGLCTSFCCISCLLLSARPVKIPLNSSITLWWIDCLWVCTVCELAEGAVSPCKLLMELLNNIDSLIDSWGVSLMTGLQLDLVLLIHNALSSTLWTVFVVDCSWF